MKNPKFVFAVVLAVVFCFAGYNLWSYFKEQQVIQAAEDLRIEQRRAERAAERARVSAELEAQRLESEQTKEQARLDKEARKAEEVLRREEARIKAEAEAEVRRAEQKAEQAAQSAQRLAGKTKDARTITHVPEIHPETLINLIKLSPRYVLDKPVEFLGVTYSVRDLNIRSDRQFMVYDGMDAMMLFSIIDQDRTQLQALIDIGMDVNASNEGGFTPLMFAAAYAYPETARFLIKQGADINAQAYVLDLNALHIAALKNPDPKMVEVFLDAGLALEGLAQNGYTPLQLAAIDNMNIEVVEALIDKGANIDVYDEDGKSVKSVVQERIDAVGGYRFISKEVNARVLEKLEP
ncbi:ankyrin repeat domain-containing protein [Sulfitobacter geojensis]|uniref:Ankyrin repeat domain-containing protein n=1 Tax=Sulfitobacter geojensis TaxID=1342299 RepID=A0AAE2W245_9RHOB|nr:ankyrin repeat domain-containing protein [Sulfitobacter geojensis]MBM1691590.1 ankyrin repeat domain-containing protein [Sulfitobacter geojensis]MBM1695645.1 ankyrin repeat domain-containing protein [Sulfitobacter geojensis]MBM1707815.1 ankyrin repeat domain-containing protein [Sulfitobacter geojensis]MBM1711886.1 ankyrin repeat domain-containing protein [Sulfitobacter geojensis]MBM1715953.1 ankyrin repeat domain-containing protein [Sulfitobacter geojensis]